MIPRARSWFAFLGGALAWTVHFMGSYAISEGSCLMGAHEVSWQGLTVMTWLLTGISVVCLAVAGASIFVARHDQLLMLSHANRGEVQFQLFMAQAGLVSNLIFTLVILAQTLPIFILGRSC